jgi:hypothetical protein
MNTIQSPRKGRFEIADKIKVMISVTTKAAGMIKLLILNLIGIKLAGNIMPAIAFRTGKPRVNSKKPFSLLLTVVIYAACRTDSTRLAKRIF